MFNKCTGDLTWRTWRFAALCTKLFYIVSHDIDLHSRPHNDAQLLCKSVKKSPKLTRHIDIGVNFQHIWQ